MIETTAAKPRRNGSILNFFRKCTPTACVDENGLFVDSPSGNAGCKSPEQSSAVYDSHRFNETAGPVKRQKCEAISTEAVYADTEELYSFPDQISGAGPRRYDASDIDTSKTDDLAEGDKRIKSKDRVGPFLTSSDSEEDKEEVNGAGRTTKQEKEPGKLLDTTDADCNVVEEPTLVLAESHQHDGNITGLVGNGKGRVDPPLLEKQTSCMIDEPYPPGNGGDFEGFEGMDEDEMADIEQDQEELERRCADEQIKIERDENGPLDKALDEGYDCPICQVSLDGMTEQKIAIHVNRCLDGGTTPPPPPPPPQTHKTEPESPVRDSSSKMTTADNAFARRFRRGPPGPKPSQPSPFNLGSTDKSASAFSKLMASHAEDAAWANAAAAETAARGRPAYERTCPFYKIIPGFSICVDAFRYGAVEGCKAYFLSHFHSDHYIGLTSTWSHGPIYCSRVTANLVKQQLRVNPRYVHSLEFEEKEEVPGTGGATVTMIPANHCPGSSLFLFEKLLERAGRARLQRILHCGDFRASKAHISHPLLRPFKVEDGEEQIQQKIDVCYLDTTYLNPKYAFPCQDAVIQACAELCVSLSKTTIDPSDGWEQAKRDRAGNGIVKFVNETAQITADGDQASGINAMAVNKSPNARSRGRLLVIVGTYSIGKERICMGIARALNCKIYAPAGKLKICACLEDPELDERLTNDPRDAQIHMTPLFEIRAETLKEYLNEFRDHFTRAVGFRPTGWNYRPPNSRFIDSPSVRNVLHSPNWKSDYSMKELVPQRGSTNRESCFGVPYSEHSSFRELTMFCCALHIDKIIPTVNVGSAKSREKMKAWTERWAAEKKKSGLFRPEDNDSASW